MARQVLDASTQWLGMLSDSMKEDLTKIMVPFDAPEGHVFVEEGQPITSFLIVESGFLTRTKASAGDDDGPAARRRSSVQSRHGNGEGGDDHDPIAVDDVGPGRATGFLHVAGRHDDEAAFATITAGKGGARVWSVDGDDFRKLCEGDPAHASEMIRVLSLALRSSLKLVQATLRNSGGEVGREAMDGALRVLCYDTTSWVRENFAPSVEEVNGREGEFRVRMDFTQDRLDSKTARFAAGYDAVCLFVNDTADKEAISTLSMCGVKMIAMRCAGFDRVDIKATKAFGISVARVPAYSPYAVAEHAIALLMSVNRRITASWSRVKMADFTLDASLLGMDVHGKTVGVMGTGKIGQILCRIVSGFGAELLAYDVFESDAVKALGGTYVSKEEIYKRCDVIFLMMPLLPATRHTINDEVLPLLKKGVILINTSRGGLIDTPALVRGLQSGTIGGCGLDVYENEGDYFFRDWSGEAIEDMTLTTLLGSNRVVMTAHQAFFTREAIDKIVSTTMENLENHARGLRGKDLPNGIC